MLSDPVYTQTPALYVQIGSFLKFRHQLYTQTEKVGFLKMVEEGGFAPPSRRPYWRKRSSLAPSPDAAAGAMKRLPRGAGARLAGGPAGWVAGWPAGR